MGKIPQITIDGITYTAPEPKARLWREFAALDEKRRTAAGENFLETYINIIVFAFQSEKITAEILLDLLDIADVLPLYIEVQNWINGKVVEKLKKIPNAETPEE